MLNTINVTKAFLPPLDEYKKYLDGIWERVHLTNHGPLANDLEEKLRDFLGVKHFFFVNNGTIALQIAIKSLDLRGEIITTPFSYVATTSAIVWENAIPVFVDIEPSSFTIDPTKIESAITTKTSAILATHVYGIPCRVEAIESIAKKHNLKVIYDAAHAFGVKYKNESLLNYGDVSTLSFHATKLFHTVEGGALITNDDEVAHRISYMRNFGHKGQEDFWGLGINGKNSELHAAMGLCNLKYIEEILAARKELSETYSRYINEFAIPIQRPAIPESTSYNFSYYPVLFETEKKLLAVKDGLNANGIYPRRYFYPALHTLPFMQQKHVQPIAESTCQKVMCLPLFHDLTKDSIKRICKVISQILRH